jgi:hypothetical protein
MGIAGWFATLFISFLLYNAYETSKKPVIPDLPGFLVPQQVGKQRNLGGSSRDASMFTENTRRRAVIYGKIGSPRHVMRETTHTTGFSTGVVDMSLTGICERICEKIYVSIVEGGNAEYEGTDILDGNGEGVLDGGPACQDCYGYDAQTAGTEASTIFDGSGWFSMDGGTANTSWW